MLAGGGVKIPFQAGVLQVWLDEAGIEFDHADAVSAACFNLAMWAQGMSGAQIAANWRNANPLMEVSVDFHDLAKLLYAPSLFNLDNFRNKVFPAWNVDIGKIRTMRRAATFNVYNFSKHELRPVEASELTEDLLIATASLPVWFPPVKIDGDTYIDAVFNLASNLEEAIRRGSDELWVIWTISEKGEWFDGFVGNFFGIFEATTVNAYKQMLARIERNNGAISGGGAGEFGRPIKVCELKAEVPIHYLFNFSQDRAAEAVNRGVEAARAWCDAEGIARTPVAVSPIAVMPQENASLEFEEHFSGEVNGAGCSLRIQVKIDDLDSFITQPEHRATISGAWNGEALNGYLQVLIDAGDPSRKEIRYQLSSKELSVTAVRHFAVGASKDLDVSVNRPAGNLKGTLRPGALETLRELASFRVHGRNAEYRATALARFGAFYFGRLWDVYARQLLPFGPI
jgi:predicted patatin/cPLA2 family phospholipase